MLRQIIIIVSAAAILALAFFAKSILSKPEEKKAAPVAEFTAKIPARSVKAEAAKNQAINTQIPLYGRLAAYEKTDLYSEVAGLSLANSPTLRAGMRFGKGDILVQMDNTEQRLALQAQRSTLLTTITQMMPDIKIDFPDNLETWENYRRQFSLEQATAPLPEAKSDREKNYLALKNLYNQYFTIKSTEERLLKYTIYAPFSGEITQSLINTGSYIRAGQLLATLMNTSEYELEASVPLSELSYVHIGDRVQLSSEDVTGEWTGTIQRIGNTIDTKTQTVKLYVKVGGKNLRENMFLSGFIEADVVANVVEIPRNLLIEDSKLFVVTDSILSYLPVQVVKRSDNTVLVRGIPDGTMLLKTPMTDGFEGMKVTPQ